MLETHMLWAHAEEVLVAACLIAAVDDFLVMSLLQCSGPVGSVSLVGSMIGQFYATIHTVC